MKKHRFFIILLFAIIACDPSGKFIFNVSNESDYDLEVNFKVDTNWAEIGEVADTQFQIKTNSIYELFHFWLLGGPYDLGDSFSEIIVFIELYLNDTLVYEQNPTIREQWEYVEEEKWDGGGSATYTLRINNDELSMDKNE